MILVDAASAAMSFGGNLRTEFEVVGGLTTWAERERKGYLLLEAAMVGVC